MTFEPNVVSRGECAESDDVVLIVIREIDHPAYEVGIDRTMSA